MGNAQKQTAKALTNSDILPLRNISDKSHMKGMEGTQKRQRRGLEWRKFLTVVGSIDEKVPGHHNEEV
jgi:hypothetical protein